MAGRIWNNYLTEVINALGFCFMPLDPIFFVHARARALQLITLALIVDDISAEGEDVHVDHVMARIGMTVKTKGTHPTTRVAVLAGPCCRCGDSFALDVGFNAASSALGCCANRPTTREHNDPTTRTIDQCGPRLLS